MFLTVEDDGLDFEALWIFSFTVVGLRAGMTSEWSVFCFFAGTPQHDYSLQREYYGQTIYFGTKYDF